jgi:hypothetical protein
MSGDDVLVDASALLMSYARTSRTGPPMTPPSSSVEGRHLLVELEQAPATDVVVDLGALPPWAVLLVRAGLTVSGVA